jgi:hypothetical protein
VFAKIALTDDDELATTEEQIVRNMGSILIRVHRTQIRGYGSYSTVPGRHLHPNVLHEKSKKVTLSHSTQLGPPELRKHTERSCSYKSTYLNRKDSPYCTFEIPYHSRALLEVENIAPCKHEPKHSCRQASRFLRQSCSLVTLPARDADDDIIIEPARDISSTPQMRGST